MKIHSKILSGFLITALLGIALGIASMFWTSRLLRESDALSAIQEESADFNEILGSHYMWKSNLIETVMTGKEFAGVLDSESCVLGIWMRSEAAKEIKDDEILTRLENLKIPHKTLHQEAQEVVRLKYSGDMSGALEVLEHSIFPMFSVIVDELTGIMNRHNRLIEDKNYDIRAIVMSANAVTMILLFMVAMASVFFTYNIIKTLNRIITALNESVVAAKLSKKMTDTLNNMAMTFLSRTERTFDDIIMVGMGLIADTADLDKMSVWRNYSTTDGIYTLRVYSWDKNPNADESEDEVSSISYDRIIPHLKEVLIKGDSINSPVNLLPEASFLSDNGAASAFITPIFLKGDFWGFVLFSDSKNERYFSGDCAEMMRSAAFLCANAIVRTEMELDVAGTNEMLLSRLRQQELISEVSKSFVSSGESEVLINQSIERFGQHLEASRICVYEIDYENNNTILSYSWEEDGIPKPESHSPKLYEFAHDQFPETLNGHDEALTFFSCDVSSEPILKEIVAEEVKAVAGAAFYIGGKLRGVLSVEQCDKTREWQEIEVSFTATVASILAGAVMRAHMEAKLKSALEHATAASQAKGDFLSNMSHEMRTPLNTIMGMASIGKNALDVKRKDYALEKIEEASSHLLGVINDVLDMSKIEANKLELIIADFSFEKMLKKALNAISFRSEQKHQNLTITVDGRIPRTLSGDDQRLTQVIINLLSNAVKFTEEQGSITLTASLSDKTDDVYTIEIKVVDTGIGITKEQQEKLFHAFEQADGGRSRRFGGTGLGLAISKRIVELMDGEIGVESEYGKGSEFKFTFKATEGSGSAFTPLDSSVNWNSVRILAVDDTEETLSYLGEVFKRHKLVFETALSGEEAIKKIKESGGYDMYFVDYKMPGMDGFELTRLIKKHDADRKSVVIMISATDWSIIQDRAEDAGIDKYLTKPLFASDIIDCMNTCLDINSVSTKNQKHTVKDDELKGHRLLLAEDVDINRDIFILSMEHTGAQIDCASNGREALEMVLKNPDVYELILMDVQMPEMDGLESTRRIRENGIKTPIIALTANVFKEDIEKCLAAGMDDHLGKPLDMAKVAAKIRKHIKQRD
ncbi:MAG: response regulator [Oscillospiraceae bacterium]|nr:response regulator [Oscillospiraceae bacterium]